MKKVLLVTCTITLLLGCLMIKSAQGAYKKAAKIQCANCKVADIACPAGQRGCGHSCCTENQKCKICTLQKAGRGGKPIRFKGCFDPDLTCEDLNVPVPNP